MVGVVLLAAAVPTLLIANPTEPLKFTVTGCLGLAMGMQAGSARHIGVKDVTTVVGALLLRIHIGAGMATAAAITLVVAALGHLGRPGRRTENYGRPAHSTS